MSAPLLPMRAHVEQRRVWVPVRAGVDYPLLGVRWYGGGAFVRETVTLGQTSAQQFQPAVPGDLIYNRLFAWKQSFAVLDDAHRGCYASNEFPMFKPRPDSSARFLMYCLISAESQARIDSESVGATAVSRNRWPEESLLQLHVPSPELSEQLRIADFLDDQVVRIDNIIAARREQNRQLGELFASELDALFAGSGCRTRPLATATDARRPIQYGIVLPGPDFPGGVPIVKGGDIASGRLRRRELNRTDPAIEARYARSRLRDGDLVIAIRGSVGEVDWVPAGLSGANLTQDAARIAPMGVEPSWLRWVLDSPGVQSEMRRRITGATVTGINIESLKAVPIPDTPLHQQRHLARQAEVLAAGVDDARRHIEASVDLLSELKRSLITSAVTGELDASSTDGSRVPA